MTAEKVRENRMRRVAERRGMRLEKSRRRDRQALDYGLYALLSAETGEVVTSPRWITLDAVERYLDGPERTVST